MDEELVYLRYLKVWFVEDAPHGTYNVDNEKGLLKNEEFTPRMLKEAAVYAVDLANRLLAMNNMDVETIKLHYHELLTHHVKGGEDLGPKPPKRPLLDFWSMSDEEIRAVELSEDKHDLIMFKRSFVFLCKYIHEIIKRVWYWEWRRIEMQVKKQKAAEGEQGS